MAKRTSGRQRVTKLERGVPEGRRARLNERLRFVDIRPIQAGLQESIAALTRIQGLIARQFGGVLLAEDSPGLLLAGDFEMTAVRAGILTAEAQLVVVATGDLDRLLDAIPVTDAELGATPDAIRRNFRRIVNPLAGRVERVLSKAKTALALTAGAAAASKKFRDARPDIEAAVVSFSAADRVFNGFRRQIINDELLGDADGRATLKGFLQNVLETVREDLANVKNALEKIGA